MTRKKPNCPKCHDTGEVLPPGPSDAPVEICEDCDAYARKKPAGPKVVERRKKVATVKVHIGTSCLTKDLVWCECGRGLSLSGKWLYCPSCGSQIDQESYISAVEQAKVNGASHFYIDPEMNEDKRRLDWLQSQIDTTLQRRNRGHVIQTIYIFNNETLRGAIDADMRNQGVKS